METEYKIKIRNMWTTRIGDLENVIKRVDFTVTAVLSGQSFEVFESVTLGDPDSAAFIPLVDLTEEEAVAFVESSFLPMADLKAHMQHVLTEKVKTSLLTRTVTPWMAAPPKPALGSEETLSL